MNQLQYPSKNLPALNYLQISNYYQNYTQELQQSFQSDQSIYHQENTTSQLFQKCNCNKLLDQLFTDSSLIQKEGKNFEIVQSPQLTVFYTMIMRQKKQKIDNIEKKYIQLTNKYYIVGKQIQLCLFKDQHKQRIKRFDLLIESVQQLMSINYSIYLSKIGQKNIMGKELSFKQLLNLKQNFIKQMTISKISFAELKKQNLAFILQERQKIINYKKYIEQKYKQFIHYLQINYLGQSRVRQEIVERYNNMEKQYFQYQKALNQYIQERKQKEKLQYTFGSMHM